VAGPEVRVGHVRGAGLDAGEDDLDLVLAVEDAVEEADRSVPGIAEHVRRLLSDEVLDDQVATAHLSHGETSCVGARLGSIIGGPARAV
jgi:hypothetical protein